MSPFDLFPSHERKRDLDRPFLDELPEAPAPIFVLGLHRSGTTFLYQLLADVLPVAVTRLVHITHYPRLLYGRREGLLPVYEQALAEHLGRLGIADRGIDGFQVGPRSLEEYAFILRRQTPEWGFSARTAPLFDEMLRKLAALQPEGRALLLKNPFDLASAPDLLMRYPSARFIFIRRDPVRVLNSQFRNSFLYRREPEPYLRVLLEGVPLWRFNFALMPLADRVIPDGLYQQILIDGLMRSIAGQLRAHYRRFASLPAGAYIEVGYEELIEAPAPTLERIRAFLGLPLREGASPIAASPRLEPLLPKVQQVEARFRRMIADFPDANRVALPAPEVAAAP